jgi:catechol 2,3-dioxygenase-like lactoylglutathione lyase family enzyme
VVVIHHVSLEVSDLERGARFYDAVLGALGWRRLTEEPDRIGWGIVKPVFYASSRHPVAPGGGHVCFAANGIPAVKAAYEGGLGAGGTDDGAPGQRPEYGPGYYSAYLLDPDGNRVEIAVGTS